MRLSRKAGLLACGIKWNKYRCFQYAVDDGHTYFQSEWKLLESGTDDTARYTGYSLYPRIAWSDYYGVYIYEQRGEIRDASVHEPRTVYACPSPECVQRIRVETSGYYEIMEQELTTRKKYRTEYSVRDKIGCVRAAKGEYPDAKNGYTYVTTNKGYTIMEYPKGNYYAYEKA